MELRYLILNTDAVIRINARAWSWNASFDYPIRHLVLRIVLDELQKAEFELEFLNEITPLEGEICALI